MRFTTLVATSLLAGTFCQPAQAAQAQSPLAVAAAQAQQGQCREAIATAQSAIAANAKSDPNLYLLAAQCQATLGNTAESIEALRSGLAAFPSLPVLERTLGQLLFRARYDSVEAGQLLESAARSMPNDPASRHFYAQWAYLNGQHRTCVTEERAALALPGLNDLARLQMYTLLGMCHGQLPDDADARGAREAFERALEINAARQPYDPVSAFQYVQFLSRHGDTDAAERVVDQILQRAPRFAPARLERAKFYDRIGDPARAIAEAREALASDGNDVNTERAAHLLMARLHMQLGNEEEAAREQAWIEAHPNPEAPRYLPPGP